MMRLPGRKDGHSLAVGHGIDEMTLLGAEHYYSLPVGHGVRCDEPMAE
jgi:hypothetical protein